MKKSLFSICLVFLCISCGQSYEEKQRQSQAERKQLLEAEQTALKIAVLPTLDCLPLYVASERHLFDTLHVDVRLKRFNAQIDCDTALVGGSVEGAVTDLFRAERLVQGGLALEYVAATPIYWQLITNKTARLKEVKQLGDKMIAMTRYSATDYLTDQALKGVKTSAKVFRVQINDVMVRLRMLENNEMDAMWLPEPQATSARLAGHPVIRDSRDMGEHMGVMAFRSHVRKDARRNRQLSLFLRAYDMACDSLNHYGLSHYTDVFQKYYGVERKIVSRLPNISFVHAKPPVASDVEKARKYQK